MWTIIESLGLLVYMAYVGASVVIYLTSGQWQEFLDFIPNIAILFIWLGTFINSFYIANNDNNEG